MIKYSVGFIGVQRIYAVNPITIIKTLISELCISMNIP